MIDQVPEEQTIVAAIATVVHSERDGTPTTLEVDGVLYERTNQRAARKNLDELLTQLTGCVASDILAERCECMRRIGEVLVYHGQHALWQLVCLEYDRGNPYALGDDTLFLMDKPTSGEVGYKGPPQQRYNTAIEQADQLAKGAAGKGGDDEC